MTSWMDDIYQIKAVLYTLFNKLPSQRAGRVPAIAIFEAGTALIGKVGFDQATPNANEVVVKDSGVMATMQDDISLIKADLVAIRAIMES